MSSIVTDLQVKEAEHNFAERLRRAGTPENIIERFISAARNAATEEANRRMKHLEEVAARGLAGTELPTRSWHPYADKLDALANMARVRIFLGARA